MKNTGVFALIGLLVACSTKDANPASAGEPAPTPTPGAQSPSQPTPTLPGPQDDSGALQGDVTFAVLMPPRPYGSTNHDVRPRFNFMVNMATTPERCSAIATRAFFLDATGARVDAQVVPVSVKDSQAKYIEISPVEDLHADQRYWLRVDAPQDRVFVLRNAANMPSSESSELVYDFFVGSAPRVLSLMVSDKPGAAVSLQFSEPVALKSSSQHLEVVSNGKKVAVCIPSGQGCNPAENLDGLMNSAQLQIQDAYSAQLTIRLLPGFLGSGRTVGETAQFSPEFNKDGALEYDIAWTSVPDGKAWVMPSPPAPPASN